MSDFPPAFWLREKIPMLYAKGTSVAPIAISPSGIVIAAEVLNSFRLLIVQPDDFQKFEISVDRKRWAPLPPMPTSSIPNQ